MKYLSTLLLSAAVLIAYPASASEKTALQKYLSEQGNTEKSNRPASELFGIDSNDDQSTEKERKPKAPEKSVEPSQSEESLNRPAIELLSK